MASDAAVRGLHAGLPLSNSSGSSQDVIATDFQQQDSTAKNWHGPTQNLQTLNPPNSTRLADARLLQPGPFPTTQPQDTQTFYSHCEMGNSASDISHDEGLIPMPLPVIHGDSPLSANNLWGDSLVLSDPPWLIGYDFDLEALNTSVSATVDISQPLFQSRARFQDIPPILEGQTVLDAEAQQRSKSGTDKVRAAWFTQIDHNGLDDATHGGTNTGQATPVISGNQYDIGDNFRSRITARLRAPTFDDPLPSTKFLVSHLLLFDFCITTILMMPEPFCPDLFYQVQQHFPCHPWTNVSLKPKELSSPAVNYLYWKFASRVEGVSGSRNKNI